MDLPRTRHTHGVDGGMRGEQLADGLGEPGEDDGETALSFGEALDPGHDFPVGCHGPGTDAGAADVDADP
jgi:hypothetical protein